MVEMVVEKEKVVEVEMVRMPVVNAISVKDSVTVYT